MNHPSVPQESARAGSGMLATTQQSSRAPGVATLGTLFAALTGPVGMEGALLLVTGLQAIMMAGIALTARRLPDPSG